MATEGGMKLKTYRAASIADALSDIKRDLGSDAVILHTKTYKAGGLLGLGSRKVFEITATTPDAVAPRHPRRTPVRPAVETTGPSAGEALLRRAYASAIAPGADLGPRARAVRDEVRLAAGVAVEPAPAPTPISATPAVTEPVAPPAPVVTPPSQADVQIASEIASLKKLVGQVLTRTGGAAHAPAMPDALFALYTQLLEAQLADELADQIVAEVRRDLSDEAMGCAESVRAAVAARLEALIPAVGDATLPKRAPDGRPLTIALVGPTGVGKTTTIAKLAATYKLRHGRSVGLITSDTYRIAAVEQLRTYANIIGLPIEVAMTPSEMKTACARLSQRDVVLIDTAGRSHTDAGRLDELGRFLTAAQPHETHLVLSSASSERVMVTAAERFGVAKPDNVIFTKLDESVGFGVLVNAARAIGMRLSFVTTGQEVPDHLEAGCPKRLASLVLSGELER